MTTPSNEASVNEHCLNNIVQLSGTHSVTAAEDIYDSNGTKLWAKDAQITPALQERLLQRKLRKPLEATLSVAGGVDADAIVLEARQLYDTMPAIACLMGAQQAAVLETLSLVRLDPAAALLLTTARANGHGFSHAVLVSVVALSVGIHAGRSGADQMNLAQAGLLHDVGELYINPDYLHSKRRLSPEEWKHVAVHPRVGQVVLEGLGYYSKCVTRAVAEHHERADGNGYPRQLTGDKISPIGQILSLAETLSGIIARKDNALSRSCLALKLIPGEHAHDLVSVIATLQKHAHATSPIEGTVHDAVCYTEKIARVLDAALVESARTLALGAALPAQNQDLALRFQYRLRTLQQALRATGIQQGIDGPALEALGEEDANIALELEMVGREIGWRMRDMARELTLRTVDASAESAAVFAPLQALLDGGA